MFEKTEKKEKLRHVWINNQFWQKITFNDFLFLGFW